MTDVVVDNSFMCFITAAPPAGPAVRLYVTSSSTQLAAANKSSREKKIFGLERRLHFLTRFFYTSFRLMKNFGDEINFAEKTKCCPNSNRVWEKLRFRIDCP